MEDVQVNLGEPSSHNAMAAAAAAAAATATARHGHSMILGQKLGPQPQNHHPMDHMQQPHRLYNHHRHNAQAYQLHRQHLQHQLHQQQQHHHHPQLHRQLLQQHRHHPHQVGPQLSHLSQINQISQLNQLSHLNQISQINQLNHITQLNHHLQQHQHHMSQLHHHQSQHSHHPLLHSQSLPLPSPLPLRKLTLASPAFNLNLSLDQELTGDRQMDPQTQNMQMGLGLELDLDLDIREDNISSTRSDSTTGSSDSSRGSSSGSSSSSSSGSTSDQGHGLGTETGLDQDTSLSSTHFPVTYAHAPYTDDQIPDVEIFSGTTATTQQIPISDGIEIESTTDDEMAAMSMSSPITKPLPTQPMTPSPSASFSSFTLPVYSDSEPIATASPSLDSASLEGDNSDDLDPLYDLKPSASIFMKAANSKLNASAAAYKMRGLDLGFGTEGDGCGGGLLPTPTTTIQYKPQHLSESLAEFRLNAGAAVFKPLRSRGGGVGEGVPAGMGQGEGEGVTEGDKNEDYAIAEGSAVLEGEATTTGGDGGDSAFIEVGDGVGGVRGGGGRVVAGVRGGRGLLALPGLLPAPHPLPLQTHLTHGHPHLHPHLHVHPPHPHAHAHAHAHLLQRLAVKQNIRYRKQPLPDLFHAVIALMRDQSRSVSYPEIINALSVRLQRPEVELKRHVPHTLHAAVNNGYLRKDGNRYSLLTEIEQVEIMRRNQQTAERAKELEKEPLSWRKR